MSYIYILMRGTHLLREADAVHDVAQLVPHVLVVAELRLVRVDRGPVQRPQDSARTNNCQSTAEKTSHIIPLSLASGFNTTVVFSEPLLGQKPVAVDDF